MATACSLGYCGACGQISGFLVTGHAGEAPLGSGTVPATPLIFMVMAEPVARSSIRLAELLAVLSLATDLGMGQPMEHVLRQCLISLRLAQRLGLDEADRVVVYYAALIAWVGCHVDAYEQAKWFGDDMALKADFRRVDFASAAAGPMFMLGHLGAGRRWPNGPDSALPFLAVAAGRLRRCWKITGWQLMH